MKRALAIIAGLMLFLGSTEAMACMRAPGQPEVSVTTEVRPVQFDVSRSLEDLNRDNDPAAAHARYHKTVGGIMNGMIKVDVSPRFHSQVNTKTGTGCIALSGVDVHLSAEPTVYIAEPLQFQSCWFKEIFAHEAGHIEVDRAVLAKHKIRFADGLRLAFSMPEDYVVREVPEAGMDTAMRSIEGDLEAALGVLFTAMMADRQEQQQALDSDSEYQRIGTACQGS